MNSPWTEAILAELASLVKAQPPLTYAAIADKLNDKFDTVFTKNACIGRSRRLAARKARAATVYYKPRKVRTKATWHPALQPDNRKFDCRQITELERDDCHWPINNASPFVFCGRRVAGSMVYCFDHAKMAYPAMGRH